jgi:restriction endonuclease Mrr
MPDGITGYAWREAANNLSARELERLSKSSTLSSLSRLRRLTPAQFEGEIANMFRRLGYQVKQTPYSNDFGRDAVMLKDGSKFLLECKKYQEDGLSGRPDLQKFHSAIVSDRAKEGFFVTTGGFTKAAIEFSAKVPIKLIHGQILEKALTRSGPSGSSDDSYQSMCIKCGDVVTHRLWDPMVVRCRNGHSVGPTLSPDEVINATRGPRPIGRRRFARSRI